MHALKWQLPALTRFYDSFDDNQRLLVLRSIAPINHLQVLLFSTMTRALDCIEEYLAWKGWEFLRLDGSSLAAERGELVSRFNDPGAVLVNQRR